MVRNKIITRLFLAAVFLTGCDKQTLSVSMVGDSLIAQMVGVQASQISPFNTAQNLGESGATTGAIRATIANLSPSVTHVIIEGGVNDFIGGTDGQIIANYTAMLKAVSTPKIAVLVGILPVDFGLLNSLRPDYTAKVDNKKIAEMNGKLTALCQSFKNCTPALKAMSLDMVGKTADGMHFTAASYPDFIAALMPSL